MSKKYDFLLHSGEMLDYAADTYPICIEDIARGLKWAYRTKGQAPIPWSVLEHSILVYRYVKMDAPDNYALQMYALLHDCEEAIIADIPTGGKEYLDDMCPFLKLELEKVRKKIMTSLALKHRFKLDINEEDLKIVDKADNEAFIKEIGFQPISHYRNNMITWLESVRRWLSPRLIFSYTSTDKFIRIFNELVIKLGGTP